MVAFGDCGRYLFRLRRGVVACDRAFIMEGDVTSPIEVREPSISVEFRLATPGDIDSLTPKDHGDSPSRKLKAKESLEQGNLCTVGLHQDQIVHIGWIGFQEFDCAGRKFPLGSEWVDMYDVRTVERYRNKGLHGAGMRYRYSVALSRGAKRKIGIVYANNEVSLRNNLRVGDKVIGTMWTGLLLRLWRYTWAPRWLGPYLLGEGDRLKI